MATNLRDKEIRAKVALQIVKARVPGYKMTKSEWKDEASLVPDVYIDNIINLLSAHERKAVEYALRSSEVTYAIDVLTAPDRKTAHDGKYQELVDELLKSESKLIAIYKSLEVQG